MNVVDKYLNNTISVLLSISQSRKILSFIRRKARWIEHRDTVFPDGSCLKIGLRLNKDYYDDLLDAYILNNSNVLNFSCLFSQKVSSHSKDYLYFYSPLDHTLYVYLSIVYCFEVDELTHEEIMSVIKAHNNFELHKGIPTKV